MKYDFGVYFACLLGFFVMIRLTSADRLGYPDLANIDKVEYRNVFLSN